MDRTKLTKAQWATLWACRKAHPRGYVGQPQTGRQFREAVRWVVRSGAQRRLLPAEVGNGNRMFTRLARWRARGVWADLHRHVASAPDLPELLLDSTVVQEQACAAGVQKAARQPKS